MHVIQNKFFFASIYFFLYMNIKTHTAQTLATTQPLQSTTQFEKICSDLNNPIYVEHILPSDFSHIQALLLEAPNDGAYVQSIIRLFTNLLKRTPYINAYTFEIFIKQLPALLKQVMTLRKTDNVLKNIQEVNIYNRFQAAVNDMLFTSLSSKFYDFKQDPTRFLNNLSLSIVELAQDEIMREQLRTSLIRFLEISINKLMWNPADFEATWYQTQTLADHCASLLKASIITDTSDLDDLYWSLIQRYTLFIKLNAMNIPSAFYTAIEKELDMREIPLLSLEEQESFIESKRTYFIRIIIDCKAKGLAYNQGLLTQ